MTPNQQHQPPGDRGSDFSRRFDLAVKHALEVGGVCSVEGSVDDWQGVMRGLNRIPGVECYLVCDHHGSSCEGTFVAHSDQDQLVFLEDEFTTSTVDMIVIQHKARRVIHMSDITGIRLELLSHR